jgi:hypothetical protein
MESIVSFGSETHSDLALAFTTVESTFVSMPNPKRQKTRRRYSIGECYGIGFEVLSASDRLEYARTEFETDERIGKACPFQHEAICIKKGGVCSLRLYEQTGGGPVTGTGPLITTCPNRFLQDELIFKWVGETILNTAHPIKLTQIDFLDRLRPEPVEPDEETEGDFIGRIDGVIVHPSRDPIDWCALELQAVYFSGKSMKREFALLSEAESLTLPFPAAYRRPDWRSSGPKRLLPQLQTKVPTISRWGKRMAVIIDEAFFASLVGLERERHLSNADIAWFVVGYDAAPGGWKLAKREVAFTKLESSVKALTGGVPLSKERFEEQLRAKLAVKHPEHPLVRKK